MTSDPECPQVKCRENPEMMCPGIQAIICKLNGFHVALQEILRMLNSRPCIADSVMGMEARYHHSKPEKYKNENI